MRRTFELISDPGHGWLKVDFATLEKLGLKLGDFSSCSYLFFNRNKGAMSPFILLEEDCDATLFLKAYREKTGQEARTRVRYTDRAAVRFHPRYYPNGLGYYKYFARNTIESGVIV